MSRLWKWLGASANPAEKSSTPLKTSIVGDDKVGKTTLATLLSGLSKVERSRHRFVVSDGLISGDADLVIVVYARWSRSSFDNVDRWVQMARQWSSQFDHPPILVVGNTRATASFPKPVDGMPDFSPCPDQVELGSAAVFGQPFLEIQLLQPTETTKLLDYLNQYTA